MSQSISQSVNQLVSQAVSQAVSTTPANKGQSNKGWTHHDERMVSTTTSDQRPKRGGKGEAKGEGEGMGEGIIVYGHTTRSWTARISSNVTVQVQVQIQVQA